MSEGVSMRDDRDPRTYAIIGAAMEVHRELGPGFLESVYHEALSIELSARSVQFEREVVLPIHYKRKRLAASFRADFICCDSVLVEIKALQRMSSIDDAQVLNYLKATGHEVGLLLNFGATLLEWKRIVLSSH